MTPQQSISSGKVLKPGALIRAGIEPKPVKIPASYRRRMLQKGGMLNGVLTEAAKRLVARHSSTSASDAIDADTYRYFAKQRPTQGKKPEFEGSGHTGGEMPWGQFWDKQNADRGHRLSCIFFDNPGGIISTHEPESTIQPRQSVG